MTPDELAAGVLAGERATLARAITLVESEAPKHREHAEALLSQVLPRAGGALRVGISGVPGVGKSTFIDALGTMLTGRGLCVAVLAIDPSSAVTGGSILGDKTRMTRLAKDERAFIRPSPTSGTLGGVARKTRESVLLCEAAGFDVVLVETVGVGQSETVVAELVDFYLVLMLAGAGDELQGIKRGILEVADMVAINKADGDNVARAASARADYAAALRLMRGVGGDWDPPVVLCSALEGTGLPELWAKVEEHAELGEASGARAERRQRQLVKWLWGMVEDRLLASFRGHPGIAALVDQVEAAVSAGSLTASAGATSLLAAFGHEGCEHVDTALE